MKLLYSDTLLTLLQRQGVLSEKQCKFITLEKGKQRQKLLKLHTGGDPLDKNFPDLISSSTCSSPSFFLRLNEEIISMRSG